MKKLVLIALAFLFLVSCSHLIYVKDCDKLGDNVYRCTTIN